MTRYVYEFPKCIGVVSSEWKLKYQLGMTNSLMTGSTYITETSNPRIMATVTVVTGPNLNPGVLEVFVANLRGGHNLAKLYDWSSVNTNLVQPEYLSGPVLWSNNNNSLPWVNAGDEYTWSTPNIRVVDDVVKNSNTMRLRGLWPSRKAFSVGSEISINNRYYRISSDAYANRYGEVAVTIAPRLYGDVQKGDVVNHPTNGLFILSNAGSFERDNTGSLTSTMQFIQIFKSELNGEDLIYEKP